MRIIRLYTQFWKKIVDVDSPCRRRDFWFPTLIHVIPILIYGYLPVYLETITRNDLFDEWIFTAPFYTPVLLVVTIILFPTITAMVRRLKSAQFPSGFIFIPLLGIPWYLVVLLLGVIFAFPAGLFQVNVERYVDFVTSVSLIGFYWGPILLVLLLLVKSKVPSQSMTDRQSSSF